MARSRDFDDNYEDDDYEPRRAGRGSPPPNYLVPAILVTLCCCLVGGIIAIVNAAQVNSKWQSGDYEGAQKASDNAKMWCILSVVIGILTNGALIAIQVMAAQAGQPGR
jgi:hypothetical protein